MVREIIYFQVHFLFKGVRIFLKIRSHIKTQGLIKK
jgi:hypothetical protein